MSHKKAFTLIELLVVIAIIGLLSSIVLATLGSARDKATLAAGLQFASSLDNAIGSQSVGWWEFNECSGTASIDRSGYGSNAALMPTLTPPAWSTDTPSGKGCSVLLNGTSQYIDIGNSPQFSFTGSSQFTIAAWVNPSACVYPSSILDKFGGKGYRFYLDGSCFPSIQIRDASGTSGGIAYPTAVPLNKWTHVAVVFNAGAVTMYMNGKNPSSATFGSLVLADLVRNAYIGQAPNNPGSYFQGEIDDVRIFSSILTASEVRALYAVEAPAHEVAAR